MSPSSPDRRRASGRRRWRLGAALLLLVVAGAGAAALGGEEAPAFDGPTFATARGPLRISVSEAGTIEAREKVVLKCEVDERSTTITYIVPEGTRVEAGDLVVELDASVLTDELYDEEIDVLDTEARFLASRENLEVVKNQAEADLAQAELDLRFAREDVKKYVEGEYPKQLLELSNAVTLAEEQATQAADRLRWSEQLHDNGFLSGGELDRDRLAQKSAELEVELARAEVALLEDYTHGRELAQLESNVQQAELALERVRRRTAADIVQAETRLKADERQLQRQQAQLEDIQTQVRKCRIEAPVGGMVVYATTGRGGWRGNDEPLEVGREVREQEELIHIPVADAKSARITVHESALDDVAVGQRVLVRVDAAQERSFPGRVARISPLPDATSQWLNPDLKVYDTEIHLDGALDGLRTGMSCEAEILIEEYDDALYVPVHAVVRVGPQPTVYVVEEGALVARAVEVGLDNGRMIHVLDGLEEGEPVALAPPLDDTDRVEPAFGDGPVGADPPAGPAGDEAPDEDRDAAAAGPGEEATAAALPAAGQG